MLQVSETEKGLSQFCFVMVLWERKCTWSQLELLQTCTLAMLEALLLIYLCAESNPLCTLARRLLFCHQ